MYNHKQRGRILTVRIKSRVYVMVYDTEVEAETATEFFEADPSVERLLFLLKSAPDRSLILV